MSTIKPQTHAQAVNTILSQMRMTFLPHLVGATERDGWQCDYWQCMFQPERGTGADRPITVFDYYTGVGHRDKRTHKPKIPTAADVLYSILLDAQALDQSFYDWCAEYGSDSDSRKALAVYEACCEVGLKVRKLFTSEQRAALMAAVGGM